MNKVLHVVNSMGYGGIETLLMNIYRNIDKEKVQFDFVVNVNKECAYDDEIKKMGGKIYRIPRRGIHFLKYKKNWKNFLQQHKNEYSTIHFHVSSLTDIEPLVEAKKIGIKNRFIHSHNTYQKGIIHNILNIINKFRISKYATKLFACSTEAGKYCFANKEFEIIKNGIDAKKFAYSKEIRNEVRKKLEIDDNTVAYVNVGRFSEQKNHTFLIDIFNEIRKIQENSKLYLIGDGNKKEEIEEKVKTLGIEEDVVFMGNQSDIYLILQGMDVFILPSLHEGLPVVGIEAQASGLPIFTSNTVSPELEITNLVQFYPLSENSEIWADRILKCTKNFNRKNTSQDIAKAGYDINITTTILEKYYTNSFLKI